MIDESPKRWSDRFNVTGKNTHNQTWEDIFGVPEHPMISNEETEDEKSVPSSRVGE